MKPNPNILIIFSDGFEEIEAIAPLDIWRRAGYTVFCAGLQGDFATSARGLQLKLDGAFSQVKNREFSMVFLPGGGPGVEGMIEHPILGDWIKSSYDQGMGIAAICAAPRFLARLQLLKRASGFPAIREELESMGVEYTEQRVLFENRIWTSRGAGSSAELAFAIVAELSGPEKAKEIFSIMQYKGKWED